MSYKNFEEALEKLPKCDGYFIKENLNVNIVNEAEKKIEYRIF